MIPCPLPKQLAMKPFDTGLNAKQYCRCGLTNSKYYDTNISEVWILVLAQDNVVVVFSVAMSHLRDVTFGQLVSLICFI